MILDDQDRESALKNSLLVHNDFASRVCQCQDVKGRLSQLAFLISRVLRTENWWVMKCHDFWQQHHGFSKWRSWNAWNLHTYTTMFEEEQLCVKEVAPTRRKAVQYCCRHLRDAEPEPSILRHLSIESKTLSKWQVATRSFSCWKQKNLAVKGS